MRFIIALSAALAVSAPAEAGIFVKTQNPADQVFAACDGYAAPGKKSDGITSGSWLYGLAKTAVDERRGKAPLGQAGLTACQTALADPRVQIFATRRGHLWQAKAIHEIALGKFDEALASLARSDHEGSVEPFFDQSVGQGNRALRAVALHGKGKAAEAEAALAELERRRPYAVNQRQMAMRIRLQFEDDRAKQAAIMDALAPLFPAANQTLFWQAMLYGEFEPALRYADGVSHDDPKRHGGWKSNNELQEKYLDIVERADFAGAIAYALFVTGQIEQSAGELKKAEDAATLYMAPPAPPAEGHKWSKGTVQDFELRKRTGGRAIERLKTWRANIAMRAEAPKLSFEELKKAIEDSKQKMPMIADILGHARVASLEESKTLNEVTKVFAAMVDEERLKGTRMGFDDLVSLLPRPETAGTQLRFKQEDGFLGSGLDGFAIKPGHPAGATTVRYGTSTGSLALVDEAALLVAARYAAKEGKDAFVIDVRQPIERTTTITTCYYVCGAGVPTNSGYEVQLVVRPLASPSASGNEQRRLLRTSEVIAALAPRLLPTNAGRE